MTGHNRDDVCEPNAETVVEVQDSPGSKTAPINKLSDRELVALVLGGDQSAFEALFERHKLRVGLIAGRFFREHIEDIVQEVFTRAYFALPEFADQGEESS